MKRGRNSTPSSKKKQKVIPTASEHDEDGLSPDEENGGFFGGVSSDSERDEVSEKIKNDPFFDETPDETRLRKAKEYLSELQAEKEKNGEDEEEGEDLVERRLREEGLELKGLRQKIAHQLEGVDVESLLESPLLRGHQLSVTSLAVSDDGKDIFSGSKDSTIIHWDATTGKKVFTFKGLGKATTKIKSSKEAEGLHPHVGHVLAVALSSDGKYLARFQLERVTTDSSGGQDHLVRVWDIRSQQLVEAFTGHRGPINALAFQLGTSQLYSASSDRTVKVWNLNQMAYIDTLYGHQSEVTSLDALAQERTLSGSRDKSLRHWKIPEETQLVFAKGHTSSVDCVSYISHNLFASGSEDGSLGLWSLQKKKPLQVIPRSHEGGWVSSLACRSDLLASGSNTGLLRLWRADLDASQLLPLVDIPLVGHINALAFSRNSNILVAGMGQEHRMGRWRVLKETKNGIRIFRLPFREGE